jgi:methionine-rich copper-binding protein CopC
MKRRTLIAVLVAAAVLAVPSQASAHAGYERSEPAKDAVVPDAPIRLDVWFTQEVLRQEGNNFVRVFDEQDVQVSDGDGVVDDDDRAHMYTTFPSALVPGRYVVEWKTTSFEDSDTDDGAFCFYIAVEPTAEQQAECAAFSGVGQTPAPTAQPTEPAGASPTAPGEQPTATAVPSNGDSDDDGGTNTGAIIGGIIAGVVVVVLVGGGVAIWLRRTLA